MYCVYNIVMFEYIDDCIPCFVANTPDASIFL